MQVLNTTSQTPLVAAEPPCMQVLNTTPQTPLVAAEPILSVVDEPSAKVGGPARALLATSSMSAKTSEQAEREASERARAEALTEAMASARASARAASLSTLETA
jgi:hypothetical protein